MPRRGTRTRGGGHIMTAGHTRKIKAKGQSALEYTLLIITVASAFITMNLYIRRAVNARLHSIELEVNPGIMVEKI